MAESTTHVPLIQPTQIQPANIAGSVIEGYTQGQNLQLRQLQMQGLEQERAKAERQEQAATAQNQLRNLAAAGDQQALQKLSAFDPAGAKGIQDEMNRKVVRVGQLASTVKGTSLPNRPKAYEYARKQAELEGFDVSQWPDKYDRSVDSKIDFLTNSARDIEKMQEDPQRGAQLDLTRSQTAENYANIDKMKLETKEKQRDLANGKPMSGEAAKISTIAQGGITNISDMRNILSRTKGGISALSSAAQLPNALQGGDTQQFEVLRKDLADLLGRLRSGGQISPNEEATYKSQIPAFGDKPSTVEYKLKKLDTVFKGLDKKLTGTATKASEGDPLGIL